MKIVITGADGFIGKKLLNYLKNKKNVVAIPFDGDITNKFEIEKFFIENKNIDQLVHLAGVRTNSLLAQLKNVNIEGTKNILNACIKRGVKKIIFASSGAVYGEPIRHRSKENDPLNPVDNYGLSKKFAEEYIQSYSKKTKIKYIILRFSSIYGPGGGSVVNKFIDNVKKNNEIELCGTGEQKRNFLFIDDAVDAIIKSLYYKQNAIFNIADKDVYSLNNLIEILKTKHFKFKVKNRPGKNELKFLSEDVSKARKLLNWEPRIKLEQGIEKL
jgi:UDP-glucose 4-epimerase